MRQGWRTLLCSINYGWGGGAVSDPSLLGSLFSCCWLQCLLLRISSEAMLLDEADSLGSLWPWDEVPGTVEQGKQAFPCFLPGKE